MPCLAHVLLVALLLTATALAAACGGDAAGGDDGVAVRVNGSPVTEAQVDTVRADARLSGTADDRKTAVEEAIRRELVRQEAERLGVSVAPSALDARLAEVQARAGGAEALAAALTAAGMSEAQLREAASYGLLHQAVGAAKYGDVVATEAQVRSFYERHREDLFTRAASVKLRRIEVPTKQLAQAALAELRDGASFDLTAKKYSRDPASKANGGRLGWVLVSSLPQPLARAVASLAVGQTSVPVAAEGAWSILRLQARRERQVTAFAGVRDEIKDLLTSRQRQKKLDAWVDEARSRATIQR